MRKPVVIVFLLLFALTAALAALPYWFGQFAEHMLTASLERAQSSGGLKVKTTAYHRGWLASEAQITFIYPGVPAELHTTHRISHGPLPLARWLEGEFHLWPVQALVRSEGRLARANGGGASAVILRAHTVVALTGEGEMQLTLLDARSERLGEIQGGHGTVRFAADLANVQTQFQLQRATIDAAALAGLDIEDVIVTGVAFRSDMKEESGGLWVGSSELTVDDVSGAPMFSLQGIRLTNTARPGSAQLDLATTQSISQVRVAGESLGEFRMAVNIRRLDAAALRQYERDVATLYRNGVAAEQQAMLVFGQTLNLLAALSKTAPSLEVTMLSFRTPDGELTGRANFVLDGSRLDVASNPMLLLVALKGSAELAVPKAMMRRLFASRIAADVQDLQQAGELDSTTAERLDPAAIERIIDEALPLYVAADEVGRHLVADGEHYRIKASIRRGQVFVNDKLWQGADLSPLQ